MRPRLICAVTNDLHQDQRMQRICGTLAGAGYEVWLVGRRRRSSQALPPQPYRQLRLRCWLERGKWFYVEYNLRLFFFLLFRRAAILNAVDLDTLLPCFVVARLRGIPCVYDAHEYFTETPEVVRRPGIQRLWAALAAAVLPRLHHAYTVGDALAAALSARYNLPFAVVRNLPLRQPAPLAAATAVPPVILYQGMLNEGRGLETAIRAMHHLPHCQLWLAGEGDLSASLRQLVAAEQLTDRVVFLGFVPPAQLPALTAQAWLGLNLLQNLGLSYYYSLANKAFDYIQAGLPSLQMDFPEYRALHQQHGVFVLLDTLEPVALACKIQALLDHPSRYAALRDACLRAAAELCWEHEQQKLLAFYQAITRPPSR